MLYRIYLRDSSGQISEKTVEGDRAKAVTAFDSLINRVDLDGTNTVAVLTYKTRPVAHHKFQFGSDPSRSDPMYFWRGRTEEIRWPNMVL